MTENTQPEEPSHEDGRPQSNKKELIIGAIVVLAVIGLVATISLLVNNSISKVVYPPVAACDLLTLDEAKELLGDKTVLSGAVEPVQVDDVATSKCGYTDANSNKNDIVVAAINMRSGVNDKGVEQNRTEFASGKSDLGITNVPDLGDSAYFNEANRQLNILDGNNWIILSYGLGAAPENNSLDDALKLAEKVLN